MQVHPVRRLTLIPVALWAVAMGLGAPVAVAGQVEEGPAATPWFTVERSGGFAGIPVRWMVAADGSVRRVEGMSGVEEALPRFSSDERAALEALSAARPEPGPGIPATRVCSDCFVWTVTVHPVEGREGWTLRMGELELSDVPAFARIVGLVTGEGPGVPPPFR